MSFGLYFGTVYDSFGNVGETLYHHEAHCDDCRLEKLPSKVKSNYICIFQFSPVSNIIAFYL